MRYPFLALLTATVLSLPGHGFAAERPAALNMDGILIDPPSYDMERILFKAERPAQGESVVAALTEPRSGMVALEAAVSYLGDIQELRIVVSGYADKSECAPSDCDALAQRRAALVYDWLKSRNVTARQLVSHQGMGITDPVDFSDTDAQRQNNRRVEFRPFQMDALDQGK